MKKYMGRVAKYIQYLLLAVGILIMIRPVVHYCRWKVREMHAQQVWEEYTLDHDNKKDEEVPAVWMEIPGIDLRTIVLDRVTEENLLLYPCLESSGSTFEQRGVKVILGHRDMHFRRLREIEVGSEINIRLRDKTRYRYSIKETEILEPEQVVKRVREKRSNGEDWILLVTCYPFTYTGPAPKRFLVWAKKSFN